AQQAAAASSDPSASSSTATPAPPAENQYLTIADELSLVTYYLNGIAATCTGHFGLPEIVTATATSYLKRFYLRNTCMDYPPAEVMLTCIFLATKTENFPISIDSFAGKLNRQPSDILSLEFLVSQSLKFEYKVYHAHLALQGLVIDMQTTGASLPALSAALPKAHSFIRSSRLTSAELLYSPSQIALACFRLADASLVNSWLSSKSSRADAAAEKRGGWTEEEEKERLRDEGLGQVLEEIGEMVLEAQRNPVDRAKATDVDRRLKLARNPEKDPKSALYKKRKAEEEAARAEKDRQKMAKRPADDDGSVFD
ncbi:hypothetical protein JCM8547_008254, partial [Rhodosporidiobolus lusitaniae]